MPNFKINESSRFEIFWCRPSRVVFFEWWLVLSCNDGPSRDCQIPDQVYFVDDGSPHMYQWLIITTYFHNYYYYLFFIIILYESHLKQDWNLGLWVSVYLKLIHALNCLATTSSFWGCGESIKDSVLGGSVFLTSDILRRPHKPNP